MELLLAVRCSMLFILCGNIHQALSNEIVRNLVFPFLENNHNLFVVAAVKGFKAAYPFVMNPCREKSEIENFCTEQLTNDQAPTRDILTCIYLQELWRVDGGNRPASRAFKIEGDPRPVHKIWKALTLLYDKPIDRAFAIMKRANLACEDVQEEDWNDTRVPALDENSGENIAQVCRFMLEQKYSTTHTKVIVVCRIILNYILLG